MQFIGDNIRKFRSELNLTREELAKKIKKNGIPITPRTILNWETGESRPDANSLAEMAIFFQKELVLFFTPITYKTGRVGDSWPPKPHLSKSTGQNPLKSGIRKSNVNLQKQA